MANQTDRIQELEAQIAELQRQVAELTPKPAPPKPKPYVERPVTIIQHAAPRPPDEALPSNEQFLKVQQIVLAKFQMLEPRGDRGLSADEFHVQFRRAFSWLLAIDRLERDRVDTGRFLADWIDKASQYHRNADIGVKPFLCAAIAIGDLTIYSDFSNLPFDCSLGLRDCYRGGGDWTAGWKRVLAGNLLMPVAPPRRSSPTRIIFR